MASTGAYLFPSRTKPKKKANNVIRIDSANWYLAEVLVASQPKSLAEIRMLSQ